MNILLKATKALADIQLKKEVNSNCRFVFHQPKLPAGMKEKFKTTTNS